MSEMEEIDLRNRDEIVDPDDLADTDNRAEKELLFNDLLWLLASEKRDENWLSLVVGKLGIAVENGTINDEELKAKIDSDIGYITSISLADENSTIKPLSVLKAEELIKLIIIKSGDKNLVAKLQRIISQE